MITIKLVSVSEDCQGEIHFQIESGDIDVTVAYDSNNEDITDLIPSRDLVIKEMINVSEFISNHEEILINNFKAMLESKSVYRHIMCY